MDAYQGVLFLSAHTERHTRQIDEVKATAGYPGEVAGSAGEAAWRPRSQQPRHGPPRRASRRFSSIAEPVQRADCRALAELMTAATGEKPRPVGHFNRRLRRGLLPGLGRPGRAGTPLLGFAPRKCAKCTSTSSTAWTNTRPTWRCSATTTGARAASTWNLASVDLKVLRRILAASVTNARAGGCFETGRRRSRRPGHAGNLPRRPQATRGLP